MRRWIFSRVCFFFLFYKYEKIDVWKIQRKNLKNRIWSQEASCFCSFFLAIIFGWKVTFMSRIQSWITVLTPQNNTVSQEPPFFCVKTHQNNSKKKKLRAHVAKFFTMLRFWHFNIWYILKCQKNYQNMSKCPNVKKFPNVKISRNIQMSRNVQMSRKLLMPNIRTNVLKLSKMSTNVSNVLKIHRKFQTVLKCRQLSWSAPLQN